MDWKSLKKEQKQLAILSGLVVITFLYVGKTFILGPMAKKWTEAKKDIKELEQKVRTAESFTSQDKTVLASIQRSYSTLTDIESQFFADEHNKFAWAAELAYACGREVGLELKVSDGGVTGRSAVPGTTSVIASFVPYSINVNTECSYDQLVILLKKFESISPYTSIAQLSIATNPADFAKHGVSFKVQWPVFQNPAKRNKVISN